MSATEPAPERSESPRPAPLYGEYATPEQQRESIIRGGGTLPDVDATPVEAPATFASPAAVTSAPVPPDAPPPVGMPAVSSDDAPPARPAPSLRGDRIVTIALLVYGLYTVVTTIPQLLDVAGFAETWMQMAGVDAEFTNYESGTLWGRIAAIVFAVGWLLTALWAWHWSTKGRRAVWIPFVGAVVSFILVSACLTVPILGDPALVAAVVGAQ